MEISVIETGQLPARPTNLLVLDRTGCKQLARWRAYAAADGTGMSGTVSLHDPTQGVRIATSAAHVITNNTFSTYLGPPPSSPPV
jgi:hypothetical protein